MKLEKTQYLQLNKPELNDKVQINDFNQNSDNLDIEVQKLKSEIKTLAPKNNPEFFGTMTLNGQDVAIKNDIYEALTVENLDDPVVGPITPPQEYVTVIWGDMDGDGKITIKDTTPLQDAITSDKPVKCNGYVVGEKIPGTNVIWGDINGDGDVDGTDSMAITRGLTGGQTTYGDYTIGEEVKIPIVE